MTVWDYNNIGEIRGIRGIGEGEGEIPAPVELYHKNDKTIKKCFKGEHTETRRGKLLKRTFYGE